VEILFPFGNGRETLVFGIIILIYALTKKNIFGTRFAEFFIPAFRGAK
jgi:hypothetical protein